MLIAIVRYVNTLSQISQLGEARCKIAGEAILYDDLTRKNAVNLELVRPVVIR